MKNKRNEANNSNLFFMVLETSDVWSCTIMNGADIPFEVNAYVDSTMQCFIPICCVNKLISILGNNFFDVLRLNKVTKYDKNLWWGLLTS